MSKRKLIMMLTVLVITILTVSGFYVLTGEANLDKIINVTSSKTTDGDWEKVYVDNDAGAPYGTSGHKYYIRYTGNESKTRKVVDLEESGYGLEIKNGYPYIFDQRITNTYKMFSKEDGDINNKTLERVFIPSSIAFNTSDNGGIQENTFEGTSQEIDCIYRTPNVLTGTSDDVRGAGLNEKDSSGNYKYDLTGINYTKALGVTTYVSLDKNNIVRSDIVPATEGNPYSYNGYMQNVYVDKTVNDVVALFDITISGTEIKNVLIDENGAWTDLSYMFHSQTFTTLPTHFRLNNKAENLCRIFRLSKLEELPDNFSLPDSVTSVFDMFARCYTLRKIPNSFVIPKNTEIAAGMFYHCYGLNDFPSEFEIPDGVKIAETMFCSCYELSTTVIVPSSVVSMDAIFSDAGTSIDASKNECPITLKCKDGDNPSLAYMEYRNNVKGLTNNGRVYKQLYDWEVVYDDSGTYKFNSFTTDDNALGTFKNEERNYYLHYRGSATKVDLGVADTANKLTVDSNKVTKIFGIEVTNTYKMFAKNNAYDSNDKLYRVFIPSSVAFNTSDNGGIQENTFEGTSQEIDCIYRTPNVLTGTSDDARAVGLNEKDSSGNYKYDLTGINYTKASSVTTYVSLDSNNINRSEAVANQTDTYMGKIQNVFVTNEVSKIQCLFMKNYYNGKDNLDIPESTEIKAVLFDETPNSNWTSIYRMFGGQTFKTLPSRFRLPDTAVESNTVFGFCTNLESLPSGFKIPSNATNIQNMFLCCPKLSATIKIPSKIQIVDGIFNDAGISSNINIGPNGEPIVARVVTGSTADTVLTSANYSKVYIERVASLSSDIQSQSVVISDVEDNSTDTVATTTNDNSDSVIIEDETDWVTITVNKKSVDEVVTETQTNSDSVENVSSDSKSEEDETQE